MIGRPVITDLITDVSERIYPVGRLDFDTTGVILLTNDGDFANLITHPSKHTQKTYRVSIKGPVKQEKLDLLRIGVELDGVETQPVILDFVKYNPENGKSTLTITIYEGKNHQVKRMFEAVGYEVVKLHRISVGKITDKGLKFGQYRDLTEEEIASFYQ
jgi:23S rRNA pseudouridine2605 synthase